MSAQAGALQGVSTTRLWMLRCRAAEGERADRIIDDPWAVRLAKAVDCDYTNSDDPFRASRYELSFTTRLA
jgi:O-methyltransferase involved in polyketide biosynthesis